MVSKVFEVRRGLSGVENAEQFIERLTRAIKDLEADAADADHSLIWDRVDIDSEIEWLDNNTYFQDNRVEERTIITIRAIGVNNGN
jgi:predicted pyridoxine 5'-phosphate oxidase superfamily flavin-nucleotide-binding protein